MGEICRYVLVAAAFAGDQMETSLRERLGQTCAAEMNYRSEFLLLLQTGAWPVRENAGEIAVQKHRRELDGAARHKARIDPVKRTAVLDDSMVADTIAPCLSEGHVGHLVLPTLLEAGW
jgi:hypothetical protein